MGSAKPDILLLTPYDKITVTTPDGVVLNDNAMLSDPSDGTLLRLTREDVLLPIYNVSLDLKTYFDQFPKEWPPLPRNVGTPTCFKITATDHEIVLAAEEDAGLNGAIYQYVCRCGRINQYNGLYGIGLQHIPEVNPYLKEIFSGKYPSYLLWPVLETVQSEVKRIVTKLS